MKAIYFILFISLATISVFGVKESKTPQMNACPSRCFCPNKYAPVCANGQTFSNKCFALCHNAFIQSNRPCRDKCNVGETVTMRKCTVEKYGQQSTRERCCTWKQRGEEKFNESCKWSGPVTTVRLKSRCSWKLIGKGKRQRNCCYWSETRIGNKVTKGSKTCRLYGSPVDTSFHKGCSMKPFGRNGIRKFCCRRQVTCINGKCGEGKSRCRYVGPIKRQVWRFRCHFKNVASGKSRRRCCKFIHNCISQEGKKTRCVKSNMKCAFVGGTIQRHQHRQCHWKTFGKNGRRKHCCTWEKHCDEKKNCHVQKIHCGWVGCAIVRKEVVHCVRKPVGENKTRRMCCTAYRDCACSKCRLFGKTCRFIGPTRTVNQGCHNVKVDGATQRRCCTAKKECLENVSGDNKKNCSVKLKCHMLGSPSSEKTYARCQWKAYGKYQKRRMCCEYNRSCLGSSCKTKLLQCRYTGSIVHLSPSKNCYWKQFSAHHRRLWCCTGKKVCFDHKCKITNKHCSYKGPLLYEEPKSACRMRNYAQKGKRNWCCTWKKHCLGKKCEPVNRRCGWSGPVRTLEHLYECRWERTHENFFRRQCCHIRKVCHGKRHCVQKKLTCKFHGAEVVMGSDKKCFMKLIDKNSSRKMCCRHKHACFIKNGERSRCIQIKAKNCKFVGPIHTLKSNIRCDWKKGIQDKVTRKRCCHTLTKCIGEKCSVRSKRCKFVEKVRAKTQCKSVKQGKQTRKRCCTAKKTCHFTKEKGEQCSKVAKKCFWVGGRYQVLHDSRCKWKFTADGLAKQLVCCRKVRICGPHSAGNACSIRRQCRIVGDSVPILRKQYHKKVIRCSGKPEEHRTCCHVTQKCTKGKLKAQCEDVESKCFDKKPKPEEHIRHGGCTIERNGRVVPFQGDPFKQDFHGTFVAFTNAHVTVDIEVKKNQKVSGVAFSVNGTKWQHLAGEYFLINGKLLGKLNPGKTIHLKNGVDFSRSRGSTYRISYGNDEILLNFGKKGFIRVFGQGKGLCNGEEHVMKAGGVVLKKEIHCRKATIPHAISQCKGETPQENLKCFLSECQKAPPPGAIKHVKKEKKISKAKETKEPHPEKEGIHAFKAHDEMSLPEMIEERLSLSQLQL